MNFKHVWILLKWLTEDSRGEVNVLRKWRGTVYVKLWWGVQTLSPWTHISSYRAFVTGCHVPQMRWLTVWTV